MKPRDPGHMTSFLLCSAVVAVVTARSTQHDADVTRLICPATYSPVCACTPRKSYRAMTFHHECMLRKYLMKHADSEACKLHDGICSEDDKTCVTKVLRSRGLSCVFRRGPTRPPVNRRTDKKRSRIPVIIPRGSVPH